MSAVQQLRPGYCRGGLSDLMGAKEKIGVRDAPTDEFSAQKVMCLLVTDNMLESHTRNKLTEQRERAGRFRPFPQDEEREGKLDVDKLFHIENENFRPAHQYFHRA